MHEHAHTWKVWLACKTKKMASESSLSSISFPEELVQSPHVARL